MEDGQPPNLEDYVGRIAAPHRSALLRELLEVEVEYRRKRGEIPRLDQYRQRFPNEVSVIHEAIGSDADLYETTRHYPGDRNESTADVAFGLPNVKISDPPERIGRYRIEKPLGRGAFGQVFLAWDEELHRQVAIKVPHAERVKTSEDAEAYLAEARLVARLDHPGIVPVHDAGRTGDGRCFIVSKYMDGTSLADHLRQKQLTHTESAELVARVAEALHYAHRQGVVHRDIKPANILLDANKKPYVADFGLALRKQDFGSGPELAGTPAYMSPEQARGEGHLVDGRSDIFSLGAVLYELLTGRRPFRADSIALLLKQISSVDTRPLRQVDDTIPAELERICLKALAKKVTERGCGSTIPRQRMRSLTAQSSPMLPLQSGRAPAAGVLAASRVPGRVLGTGGLPRKAWRRSQNG